MDHGYGDRAPPLHSRGPALAGLGVPWAPPLGPTMAEIIGLNRHPWGDEESGGLLVVVMNRALHRAPDQT